MHCAEANRAETHHAKTRRTETYRTETYRNGTDGTCDTDTATGAVATGLEVTDEVELSAIERTTPSTGRRDAIRRRRQRWLTERTVDRDRSWSV